MNSNNGNDHTMTDNNHFDTGCSLSISGSGFEDLLLGERPIAAFSLRAREAREKNIAAINDMNAKTKEEMVRAIEDELVQRDLLFVEEAVAKIQYGPARDLLLRPLAPSWMFGVSPVRWQVEAYITFIETPEHGYVFRSCDMGGWMRARFDFDRDLWALFKLVRKPTDAVSKLLDAPELPNFGWFLTEDENRRLPDFYRPHNAFREALENAGILGPFRDFPYTRKILWDSASNSLRRN